MIITIHNSKGGVGKTTTTVNVGVQLAAARQTVLIVDGDLQSSATVGLGAPYRPAVYEWIVSGRFEPERQVRPGLDLLPSAPEPSWWAAATPAVVEERFHAIPQQYDWILVDTNPSYGPWVASFIEASDAVLVPVDLGFYAVAGLANLIPHIPPGRLIGIVPIRYDLRTNRAIELLDRLKRAGGSLVGPPIRVCVALDRAAQLGLAAREYDPASTAAQDYQHLTEWMVMQLAAQIENPGTPGGGR